MNAYYINYTLLPSPSHGLKFYRPRLRKGSKIVQTKRIFKRASEAVEYGRKLAARYSNRFDGC